MNRILIENGELRAGGSVLLGGRRARHLFNVLRVSPGQKVKVGLIGGSLGTAVIRRIQRDEAELKCEFDGVMPLRPAVDLLLAVPRPKVLKRLYAPLASIGVDRWWLVNAARVERCYFDSHVLQTDFARRHLVEGLEQAGATYLPRVAIRRRLKPFIEDELDALCPPPQARLMLDPGAERRLARHAAGFPQATRILLAVGPEGGWVDYERDLLADHGFTGVQIGSRILRSDTAAQAALLMVRELLP